MVFATICGSLGSGSANRMALDLAVEHVRARATEVMIADVPISSVPMLNPDLVDNAPEPVAAMRSLLDSADGVLIAVPEYAGGLAGGVKNALDWLVGSSSLYHRPVAVLSAGTTGGRYAIEQLVRTLSWHGALTVSILGISAPHTKIQPGLGFVDQVTVSAIERWAEQLIAAMTMDRAPLVEHVTRVVAPFEIDASRFGSLDQATHPRGIEPDPDHPASGASRRVVMRTAPGSLAHWPTTTW